jgi:26S proteasome regulatory subunit N2
MLKRQNHQDEDKPKADAALDDEKAEEKAHTELEEKSEPASENLSNLSRVTPVQLSYIAFPADARYQPIRPIPSTSTAAPVARKAKKASDITTSGTRILTGGGILLLRDTKPDETADYIELNPNLEKPAPPAAIAAEAPLATAATDAAQPSDMEIDDGAEAEVPAPFEYPFGSEGA